MSRFDKPFARYDRNFPNDDYFLALPIRLRLPAYGLLLAMNGFAHTQGFIHPPATGELTVLEAEAIADKCGQKARPLLAALVDVGLIEIEGKRVRLPKFFVWNPELRPGARDELSAKRAQAATRRWSKADANQDANCIATSNAKVMHKEKEKEKETERDLTSPPNPPPYQVDDMLGEFLRVVSEGLARALRPDEIDRLSSWWDQMPRLRPDLARAQIEDYLTWRRTNLPAKEVPLKGVDLLHDQLRQLDGRLADDGYPTRERRRASIQIDGMTPVSELVADVLGPTLRAKP